MRRRAPRNRRSLILKDLLGHHRQREGIFEDSAACGEVAVFQKAVAALSPSPGFTVESLTMAPLACRLNTRLKLPPRVEFPPHLICSRLACDHSHGMLISAIAFQASRKKRISRLL